jgi:hypothetical protein
LARDPASSSVARMSSARLKWFVLAAACAVPLGFAAFTGHAWEDYFITLRSSRNLVAGHGLVFTPGERLHTFTSPLGVLLPALCTALAGLAHEDAALWLFRVLNAGFLVAAAALAWRRAVDLGLGAVGQVTLFGLLLLDAKLTDFAINGMETAILVFFVLLLWSELEAPAGPRATVLALAIGGLMWTRPDAFVLAGALLGAHVAIRPRAVGPPRGPRWSTLARGLVLGGALYAPWFLWAWWYYGTPIPHTIIAKSAYMPAIHASALALLPLQTLLGQSMLIDLFMPSYWTFGGWPNGLKHCAHALSGIAALAWLAPGLPATARRASLAVFLGMFYVCSIILFPWYVPPWTALAAIALAWTVDALYAGALARGYRAVALVCRVSAVLVVALQFSLLVATAWQMRAQQRIVETGVRRDIGEWLHQHAAPTDTVFLEPLGYIGYFSQLKTYDFPGLSSPEVVAAIRGGAHRYADVIVRLRPTWLVLRPREAARPEFRDTAVLRDYDLAKSWDAVPQLDQVRVLPGRPWNEAEAQYLLFRRKSPPEATTATAAK